MTPGQPTQLCAGQRHQDQLPRTDRGGRRHQAVGQPGHGWRREGLSRPGVPRTGRPPPPVSQPAGHRAVQAARPRSTPSAQKPIGRPAVGILAAPLISVSSDRLVSGPGPGARTPVLGAQSSWVPRSTSPPPSRTTIRSLSRTVDSRWARSGRCAPPAAGLSIRRRSRRPARWSPRRAPARSAGAPAPGRSPAAAAGRRRSCGRPPSTRLSMPPGRARDHVVDGGVGERARSTSSSATVGPTASRCRGPCPRTGAGPGRRRRRSPASSPASSLGAAPPVDGDLVRSRAGRARRPAGRPSTCRCRSRRRARPGRPGGTVQAEVLQQRLVQRVVAEGDLLDAQVALHRRQSAGVVGPGPPAVGYAPRRAAGSGRRSCPAAASRARSGCRAGRFIAAARLCMPTSTPTLIASATTCRLPNAQQHRCGRRGEQRRQDGQHRGGHAQPLLTGDDGGVARREPGHRAFSPRRRPSPSRSSGRWCTRCRPACRGPPEDRRRLCDRVEAT